MSELKVCKVCGESRDSITGFRLRKNAKKRSGTCKVCDRRRQKYNFDTSITHKICCICKCEKPISDFYFLKTENRLSSYCKYCDSHRKKNLNPKKLIRNKEKAKILYRENKPFFVLKDYRKYDKKRGFINDLTIEYVSEQLERPCVYCGYPSTGLDRIENTLGHMRSNCVPCCRECNVARMDNFTHQEMFIIGLAIKQIKDNR